MPRGPATTIADAAARQTGPGLLVPADEAVRFWLVARYATPRTRGRRRAFTSVSPRWSYGERCG